MPLNVKTNIVNGNKSLLNNHAAIVLFTHFFGSKLHWKIVNGDQDRINPDELNSPKDLEKIIDGDKSDSYIYCFCYLYRLGIPFSIRALGEEP